MIRIPRTQAPLVGTPINWLNPLTLELKTAVFFTVFAWEAVRIEDTQFVLNGSGVIATAQGGKAYSQTGHVFADRLQVYSSSANDPIDYKSGFSFFSRFRYAGTSSADEYSLVWGGNTNNADWYSLVVSDTTIEDNQIHTVCLTAPPRDATGESVRLYLDGVEIGSAVITVQTDTTYGWVLRYEDSAGGGQWESYGQRGTASHPTVLGAGQSGNPNDGWHGEIYNALWWARELTVREIRQLHNNEYQIFQSQMLWLPFLSSGTINTVTLSDSLVVDDGSPVR